MAATVLIIEDNPANLELARYLVEAHGYRTLTATDGEEGVRVAKLHQPDLILCDLQMPSVNGYEVARLLRSDPAFRSTIMIAVTAFSMRDDREVAIAAGFDGYISKPIDPERLVGQVEELLAPALRAERLPPAK